jgi:hypothetical protein
MKGLVLALKAMHVLLQQALGDFKLYDITDLKWRVGRTRSGLPKWILAQDRAKIRARDYKVIRFYLTLFSLYRVLEFPGKIKISTITDPMETRDGTSETLARIAHYTPIFVRMVLKFSVLPLDQRELKPRLIMKSSPNSSGTQVSTSPMAIIHSFYALQREGLLSTLSYFVDFFQPKERWEWGTQPSALLKDILDRLITELPTKNIHEGEIFNAGRFAGKLGTKDEPAGKVRVFAMVDPWTQWALEPLHSYLFDLLEHIPMDGTFDQHRPVLRALESKPTEAYSLDLSAATDRLPISIQSGIIAYLVNPEFARRWMELLVSREYYLPAIDTAVRYAVGQPMGALSSWSMLAMTHHLLVQVSAWEAGVVKPGEWFKNYAVLGDDVVIFNQRVKKSYLRIMGDIGVKMGIAKSLLSSNGRAVEFAKRTYVDGRDVSPISLSEFIASNLKLADAIALARSYHLTFAQLLKVLGYGYQVRSTATTIHIGRLGSRVRALLLAYFLPSNKEEFDSLMKRGNPRIKANLEEILNAKFSEAMLGFLLKEFDRVSRAAMSYNSMVGEPTRRFTTALGHLVLNRFWQQYYEADNSLLAPIVAPLQRVFNYILGWTRVSSTPAAPVDQQSTAISPLVKEGLGRDELEVIQVNVKPELFNHVIDLLNKYTILGAELVSMVTLPTLDSIKDRLDRLKSEMDNQLRVKVNPLVFKMEHEREWLKDILRRKPHSKVTPWKYYLTVVNLLKEYSSVNTEFIFERQEVPLPFRSDPIMARFWKLYTRSIYEAMLHIKKESKEQGVKKTPGSSDEENPPPRRVN